MIPFPSREFFVSGDCAHGLFDQELGRVHTIKTMSW
jgi:hypothetical protein